MLSILTKLNNARIKRKIARRELPWQTLENVHRPSSTTQLIPKIVYQTWENKLVGKNHFKSMQDFININQDLSFFYFDREERASYIKEYWSHHPIQEIYERAKFGQIQADIFRYCILAERGGYYFDISKSCKKPLSELHSPTDSCFISYEENVCEILPELDIVDYFTHPDKYILQWGLGFAPNHPFLLKTIENISKYYPLFKNKIFPYPKAAIISFTGPGMLTKSIRECIRHGYKDSISQVGIDFDGAGIFAMPGSHARYLAHPDYANKKNELIVS
jgi:mannosyltransferase OCH1-like enzyme